MLRRAKDGAIAAILRFILNRWKLHIYGQMTKIEINSDTKEVGIVLNLLGETTPIEIKAGYKIDATSGSLGVTSVWVSREWMNTLIGEVWKPEHRAFSIPKSLLVALRVLQM